MERTGLASKISSNLFLIQQLVLRDFKTKYKRSFLGVAWSLFNPLLMLLVQYAVFENLFKFEIKNYAIYLLTGIILFSFFQDSATQGMMSIVSSASLINKAKLPKCVLPIAKVLSSTINLLFSMIPLLIFMKLTGLTIEIKVFLILYGITCLIVFSMGISLILSALQVFFRDVQFLWQIASLAWMYLTPIIYPESILSESVLRIVKYNPLYCFIKFCRIVLIENVSPSLGQYIICMGWAVMTFIVGIVIFRKVQNKFVMYI